MNYGNFEPVRDNECCVPEPSESLTDLMKNTNAIAYDVLNMSRRISLHLFGVGHPCCEKEADPKCFHDELVATRCELVATAEELKKICCMLGV